MTIKDIELNEIAVGSTAATAVYLGSAEVWSASPSMITAWYSNGTSATTIAEDVFTSNTVDQENLVKLELPRNVKTIDDAALNGCTTLSSIIAPKVQTLGNSALCGCIALEEVSLSNVNLIGNDAFNGCTALQYLEMPKSVLSINADAFAGCNSLTCLFFNDKSDEDVENMANYSWGIVDTNIISTEYGDDGPATKVWYYDGTYAEYNIVGAATRTNVLSSAEVEKIEFGNTVTSIGDSLFKNSTKLKYAYCGYSVSAITDSAFNECRKNNIVFGPGLVNIGGGQSYVFAGAPGDQFIDDNPISSMVFHEDSMLSNIDYGTFRDSLKMDELVIKSKAPTLNIGYWAFSMSNNAKNAGWQVQNFVFETSCVPTLGSALANVFTNQPQTRGEGYFVVPDDLYTQWISADKWTSAPSGTIIKRSDYDAMQS